MNKAKQIETTTHIPVELKFLFNPEVNEVKNFTVDSIEDLDIKTATAGFIDFSEDQGESFKAQMLMPK